MSKIFQSKKRLKALASMRQGILDAKTDIKLSLTFGFAPYRSLLAVDEFYDKAYTRTIVHAVMAAFRRTTAKVEKAIKFLKENPQ